MSQLGLHGQTLLPLAVSLAGSGLLFLFFGAFTSATGNILAWGFNGLSSLGSSGVPLFIYEFVHCSSAHGGMLGGLWLVGLASIVLYALRRITARRCRLVIALISSAGGVMFLVFNLVLFFWTETASISDYLAMTITNPYPDEEYGLSPMKFWIYTLPVLASIIILAIPRLRKIPGSEFPLSVTWPLAIVPFVAANYFSYQFLCFRNPEVYTQTLQAVTPLFLIGPVVCYTTWELRKTKDNKSE